MVGHAAALRVHGHRYSISSDDGTPKNPDYEKELGPKPNARGDMNQIAVIEGGDGPPKNPDYDRELGPKQPQLYDADLETTAGFPALQHGSKVSLQVKAYKILWFSCPSGDCTWTQYASNVGMYQFNTDPITNFFVYRRNGPGNVVVGDVIALYFPKESGKWFSMLGCKPHLSACPGAPSSADGMSTEESWYMCSGEVFKIYARNKKLGEAIVANDDVKLYYLGEGKMVGIWGTPSCDSAINPPRPPASNTYTYYDTLEVYIA
eukprot:Em0005g574a